MFLKNLKSLINRFENVINVVKEVREEEVIDMKKKVAFIVGHHEKAKGAYSGHFDATEWDFYSNMELDLAVLGDVYYHNSSINSYKGRCEDMASRINEEEYELVIALHFNAFNGSARGVECLFVEGNSKTQALSKLFSDSYAKKTGAANRGAKPLNRQSRGFWEIGLPKANAILVEPFFGDNPQDAKRFTKEIFIEVLKEVIDEA